MPRKKGPIQIHPDLEGRSMPPEMEAALRQSLIEVGQLHPILLTDDNYIIEGSVRWRLLLEIHGPDCPVDFINVGCHSGIGKLPKTLAYKHSTIEDEYETTQDRLKALRPWSWSTPKQSEVTEPKVTKPRVTKSKVTRGPAVLAAHAFLKTNGPSTAPAIAQHLASLGFKTVKSTPLVWVQRGHLIKTGTLPNPGGGRPVHVLDVPSPS